MLMRHIETRGGKPPTSCLEPLGPGRHRHVAAVVAELAPGWSVELHHDIHGKATIVILPADLDAEIGPTLIIDADEAAFHLEELNGDSCRTLGEHRVWADLLRAVRTRLVWELPLSATRH